MYTYATRRGERFPEKVKHFLKYHLHIALYTYFWFGLFVCGLVAPPHRVAALESDVLSRGWQLSVLSLFLVLPVPVLYVVRMRKRPSAPGNPDGKKGGSA